MLCGGKAAAARAPAGATTTGGRLSSSKRVSERLSFSDLVQQAGDRIDRHQRELVSRSEARAGCDDMTCGS
jgi:hypothetical protein